MKNLLTIKDAQFVLSVPEVSLLPEGELPEFAFLGRSNVGKSSLLNYLANRKGLANVSKTPGRTRALNLFKALLLKKENEQKEERSFVFMDLPGYGYAKLSLQERGRLSEVLAEYLENRPQLKLIFHLLDCRHEPTQEDLEISQMLQRENQPFRLVLTKGDKLIASKKKLAINSIAKALHVSPADCILTSVEERMGQEELLQIIWNLS